MHRKVKFSPPVPGRVGERARAAHEQVRAGDAGQEEEGRAERADAEAPAGEGGPGEEYDAEEG